MPCDYNRLPQSPYLPGCPTPDPVTVIGQVGAEDSFEIPVGATSWSFSIIGDNGEVNTIAMADGTSLSGSGPLDAVILLEAGLTTEINYTYIAP